ncbi:MAG: hypothetical protein WHV44_15040 [Anaerolineales bacterium]
MTQTTKPGSAILLLVSIFLLGQIVTFAWMSDDAFITMRVVDNVVHGYGPTWNIAERVQVFTHPLWMLLLSLVYAVIPNEIFAPVILSLAFSAGLIGVVIAFHRDHPIAAGLSLMLLFLGQSFMHYVSSGLENPATNFFMAAFTLFFLRLAETNTARISPAQTALLGLIAAAALLNRVDTAVFFAPALLYVLVKNWRGKTFGALALSMLPLVSWFVFSLIYYGFFFPNTAYAKLNTGIPTWMLVRQGFTYLLDSAKNDPLTLFVIIGAVIGSLRLGKLPDRVLAAGMLMYLAYILYIGGDFMSGRFLSGLFVVGVLLLTRYVGPSQASLAVLGGLTLLMAYLAPYSPLKGLQEQPQTINYVTGIANERAFYQETWLVNLDRTLNLRNHFMAFERNYKGERVPVVTSCGFYGFYAPRDLYIVDTHALTNPLLARLPVPDPTVWRIGHFERHMPAGYLHTLESGINKIEDPQLAEYYDHLALITRGDLWSAARWQAIWKMNTGQYDDLLAHLKTQP